MYDKDEIKKQLTTNDIFELVTEWGGNPTWNNTGFVSDTICHNPRNCGASHKLYFYSSPDDDGTGLFHCYTGCEEPSFDIFQLTIKVFSIQDHQEISFIEAVRFIAFRFGISESFEEEEREKLPDWDIFSKYEHIQKIEPTTFSVELKGYDKNILKVFDYDSKLRPWLDEGISQEVLERNQIGYFPATNQITIPHFDKNGKLVGLRGRSLTKLDADLYGKYRPLVVNGKQYNHPLGMNLYGLDKAKRAIKESGRCVIFEGEKSALKGQTYFGIDNDIYVACCGSNVSNYQVHLLFEAGAHELIIALDRQFQAIGDDEFKKLKRNLMKIYDKYHNYAQISFIFDKNMITGYKSAPIDEGVDKFIKLFNERIIM